MLPKHRIRAVFTLVVEGFIKKMQAAYLTEPKTKPPKKGSLKVVKRHLEVTVVYFDNWLEGRKGMESCGANGEVNVRPFAYAMSLIDGKWKMHILFWLWKRDVLRYGELKRSLETITHKMLSTQLKELEADDLIVRKEFSQIPPKVEYSLSERGLTLMPVLQCLCEWGNSHMDDDKSSENRRGK